MALIDLYPTTCNLCGGHVIFTSKPLIIKLIESEG